MHSKRDDHEEPNAAADADLLALGLGCTGMMAMIAAVARGRRVVGVEMRGDPAIGVHFNIREDWFHLLGWLDQMMLERHGEAGVPRRDNGEIFKLADVFYTHGNRAGDIVPDEVISGYTPHLNLAGCINDVEYIDDRPRDGVAQRVITRLPAPVPPTHADPAKIRRNVREVLDGPSTFQTGAVAVLQLLRRYLEAIEREDLARGVRPRVRLFTEHRVIPGERGFVAQPDGRQRVRIEKLHELDLGGRFRREREPGSDDIDLGVPGLIYIAEGFSGNDGDRLGFVQEDVRYDHGDGRGPQVAQADFVAGLIETLVDGRLRRRISSEVDGEGREYWVRQIAVGHENDPEVGWVLCQVPDFMSFDPIEVGKLPADTDRSSPQYFAAYQQLMLDFYVEQAAAILEIPAATLRKTRMVYGPQMFSLVERIGRDAQVAANAVVAGDNFGNGHFMTSGGAMTGMVGHTLELLAYYDALDGGAPHAAALRALADGIKRATEQWLEVSAKEFTEAIPINFGAERGRQIAAASGIDVGARAHRIDASRRVRRGLGVLTAESWRRPIIRPGVTSSRPLPKLSCDGVEACIERTFTGDGAPGAVCSHTTAAEYAAMCNQRSEAVAKDLAMAEVGTSIWDPRRGGAPDLGAALADLVAECRRHADALQAITERLSALENSESIHDHLEIAGVDVDALVRRARPHQRAA